MRQQTFSISTFETPSGTFDAPTLRVRIAGSAASRWAKACAARASEWKALTRMPEFVARSNPPATATLAVLRGDERGGRRRTWDVAIIAATVAVVVAVVLIDNGRARQSLRTEGSSTGAIPVTSAPLVTPPETTGIPSTGSMFLVNYMADEPEVPKPEPSYQGKPLSAWVKMLGEGDPATRTDAVSALSKVGDGSKDAAKALATALNDPNRDVARLAALALGSIGDVGVPPLISGLQDKNEDVRGAAQLGLIRSGKAAVPATVKLLASTDKTTVASAATVLANIGRPAVPALIAALKSDESQVRGFAALAIGEIGKDAKEAIPALRELLTDGHAGVRATAEATIKKISR